MGPKHVTLQNHFVIAKFKKLKILKQNNKKILELSPSPSCLFLRQQIHFFGWIWYLSLRVQPVFFRIPLKIRVKRQKQPLELFCKKLCLQKFRKFHIKTLMFKSLFNRVFRIATLFKSVSNTGVFQWNLRNFWKHLFWRRSANDCFWNLFKLLQDSLFLITYTSGLNCYICFRFRTIIYSFICQFSLCYYCYSYHKKQSSGDVLQKRCSYKFRKIHEKNTCAKDSFLIKLQIYRVLTLSKKRFRHRCFLVNSAKFLITLFLKNPSEGCFCKNTRSVCCPTTTLFFSKTMSHIFSDWVFSRLSLQTWNKSKLNISSP